MSQDQLWHAVVTDSNNKEIARAKHNVGFEQGTLAELMDLLDYAYYASAEKPLLTMPSDHEITITIGQLTPQN